MIEPAFREHDTTRIGLIVPSSNVTMEIEIPSMLRAREEILPEKFSFHSMRIKMNDVTPEGLREMYGLIDGILPHLLDADVDIVMEACLVAAMQDTLDKRHGRKSGLRTQNQEINKIVPFLTSADALTHALEIIDADRIALIAPYIDEVMAIVLENIGSAGIEIADYCGLGISDNSKVGRLDPANLVQIARTLELKDADALVISACVQMPSLPVIEQVESELGIPVLSAATATTYLILKTLGMETKAPRAGTLLSGKY